MSTSIIVIPCYNEAARLDGDAFKAFARESENVRFMFADDGSSDATPEVLARLRDSAPNSFLVHTLPTNTGKAEAVRQGLLRACDLGPDYVGFWDADLATPLDEIDEFVGLLDTRPEIEMVFGARVHLLGRSIRRRSPRHYLGRVFATFAAVALGMGIYDTQCGAKVFRVTDRLIARLREPFIGGWIFDVEIIAREIQARRGTDLPPVSEIIYEHPLRVWRDVAGSKIRTLDLLKVGIALCRIYLRYIVR